MIVIKREDYEKIIKKLSLSIESIEKCIDVYHKNNWDRFTMHYDEENKNECPSHIYRCRKKCFKRCVCELY